MNNFKSISLDVTPHDCGGTLPNHVTVRLRTEVSGQTFTSLALLQIDDLIDSPFDMIVRDLGERMKFELRKDWRVRR